MAGARTKTTRTCDPGRIARHRTAHLDFGAGYLGNSGPSEFCWQFPFDLSGWHGTGEERQGDSRRCALAYRRGRGPKVAAALAACLVLVARCSVIGERTTAE